MVKKRVKVVQCRAGTAYVELVGSSCGYCAGACPASVFSGWFASSCRYGIPRDSIARPGREIVGTEVDLGIEPARLLAMALRYYGLPIAALVFGMLLAMPVDLSGLQHDVVSAASGLGAFLLCQWYLLATAQVRPRQGLTVSGTSKQANEV